MKPRYIRVASDLHLEQYFGQRAEFLETTFLPKDERDAESVLVLAGDISSKPNQLYEFLRQVETRFMRVIYVPGNHEYYGHNMKKWAEDFHREMSSSTILEYALEDASYEEMDGVRFVFATMWADGGASLADRANVGRGLRDFYVINVDQSSKNNPPRRFTVPDMVEIHKRQKQQIEGYIEKPFDGKTVVITHHMPSYRLCHPRFGTEINGGFASNCDLLLATEKINLWIFGHTHDTIDQDMWKTRVVCNPSGYYMENDTRYKQFTPKFIEIEKMNEDQPPA